MSEDQGAQVSEPKASGGGFVGCLIILLIVAVMLGLPFLAFLVFKSDGGGMAWPFLGMGFAIFALLSMGGLRSGTLPARYHSIKRSESPIGFYIGVVLYGLCALAMYIGYVVSLFC